RGWRGMPRRPWAGRATIFRSYGPIWPLGSVLILPVACAVETVSAAATAPARTAIFMLALSVLPAPARQRWRRPRAIFENQMWDKCEQPRRSDGTCLMPAGSGCLRLVMGGLDPRIHWKKALHRRGWIAGSSPAMTADGSVPTAVGVTSLTTMSGLVGPHRAAADLAAGSGLRRGPHSTLMLVVFTMSAHLRASAARKALNSRGVGMFGSPLDFTRVFLPSAGAQPATTPPVGVS